MQHDVLGDGRPQQVQHLIDQPIQVERLDDQLPFAGVGQQLAGQLGGAVRGGAHLRDRLARGRLGRKIHKRQLGIPQNGHQQVVEIVGDAAREHAQAFHTLDLLELALQSRRCSSACFRAVMSRFDSRT